MEQSMNDIESLQDISLSFWAQIVFVNNDIAFLVVTAKFFEKSDSFMKFNCIIW